MAKDISGPKQKLLKKFNKEVKRARHLDRLIIRRGYYTTDGTHGPFRRLRVPEQRDIAEYIAFEAATGFEYFSREVFILAARKQYGVQPSRAEYIMGTIDRGLSNVNGWGAPASLKKRATSLFGKRHFIATLQEDLPPGCYEVLIHAHKIRNRIAHQSGRQSDNMEKTYNFASVPARSRSGLSMGRLLLDYKAPAPVDRQLLQSILCSYRAYSRLVAKKL